MLVMQLGCLFWKSGWCDLDYVSLLNWALLIIRSPWTTREQTARTDVNEEETQVYHELETSISALIQGTIHAAILMSTNCHWIVGGLPHQGSQWLSSLEDKLHASVVAHTWERLAVSKTIALFSDPKPARRWYHIYFWLLSRTCWSDDAVRKVAMLTMLHYT